MIDDFISKVKNEYGSKKMSPKGLFALVFFVPMLFFVEWSIHTNTFGVFFNYPLRYMQLLIISVAISIVSGVLFYNGKSKRILKIVLTTITCIAIVSTFVLFIPIGILFRTKEFIEIITRFKLDETKTTIYIISLTISWLIISIYIGIGLSLYPILNNRLSGDYIFVLLLLLLFIFTFNLITKWTYKIYIRVTKTYYFKKKLLHSYFQNYKEKNIVVFLFFIFITLYVYSQKNPDSILDASVSSITTIVLLDALIDKWKSKFHKTDTEYRFIELIYLDIQFISNHIEQYNISNTKIKINTHNQFDLMSILNETTNNKTYKKIFASYKALTQTHNEHDYLVKSLFDLEWEIINYIVKCT